METLAIFQGSTTHPASRLVVDGVLDLDQRSLLWTNGGFSFLYDDEPLLDTDGFTCVALAVGLWLVVWCWCTDRWLSVRLDERLADLWPVCLLLSPNACNGIARRSALSSVLPSAIIAAYNERNFTTRFDVPYPVWTPQPPVAYGTYRT